MSSDEITQPARSSMSPTATELVQRCQRGDATAWNMLVQRYAGLVHSIPIRHGLSPMDVDDVGQETFLALARHVGAIENPEALASWLAITARRLSWRAVQKRRREENLVRTETDDEDPGRQHSALRIPGMEILLRGWHRQEALQQGLARLDNRCRELLRLLFLDTDEPSYEQVCARLNMSIGSIGPTRSRCLRKLRTILEGLGFAD